MSYGAVAWWCIVAINFGRWSFFIINVQPEHRNLLGCLEKVWGECTAFSPLWSDMPNCLLPSTPHFTYSSQYRFPRLGTPAVAMPSPLPYFLTFTLPLPALSYLLCCISGFAVAFSYSLAPAVSAPCFNGFLLSSSSSPIQQRHKHHFRRLWDSRWPMPHLRTILPKLKALCKWAALAKSYAEDSCRKRKGIWDA